MKTPELVATVKGITRSYSIFFWKGFYAAKREGFKPVIFKSKKDAISYAEFQSGKPGK